MSIRLIDILKQYKIAIVGLPLVTGGTWLGFKLRGVTTKSENDPLNDAKLKLREDGLAEYKFDEKTTLIVTQEEINLRYRKIQLEQVQHSLKDRIKKLDFKINQLKHRIENQTSSKTT